VNETTPTRVPRARTLAGLGLALVVALGGAWAWQAWHARQDRAREAAAEDQRQLEVLLQRMETVRGDINAQGRLIKDAAAGQRLLRDELLGLGQRNALLEETVARLAASTAQGHRTARLDEAELLLVLGAQRLRLAGDVDGARRAYALAAGLLDGLEDPGLLNLRHTLASERRALEELGAGPRAAALARLQAVDEALARLPRETLLPASGPRPPWWQRALAPLVQIRPAGSQALLGEAERALAVDALQLELTLARAAVERGDVDALRTALNRIDTGVQRLWPDSPPLRQLRDELETLRSMPLQPQAPALDATLLQLRAARDGGSHRP